MEDMTRPYVIHTVTFIRVPWLTHVPYYYYMNSRHSPVTCICVTWLVLTSYPSVTWLIHVPYYYSMNSRQSLALATHFYAPPPPACLLKYRYNVHTHLHTYIRTLVRTYALTQIQPTVHHLHPHPCSYIFTHTDPHAHVHTHWQISQQTHMHHSYPHCCSCIRIHTYTHAHVYTHTNT